MIAQAMPLGVIHPATLSEFLDYNPETGELRWKRRREELFPSQRTARVWNTKWAGKPALACPMRDGHLHGNILGRRLLAHRAAWALYYGKWPSGQIDHINGDPADNRISNLRDVPAIENQRNMKRPANNTSGRVGVYQHANGSWVVRLSRRYVGSFKNFNEAASARSEAERKGGYHSNHGR